jgi:hypothetical protein
MGLGKFPVTPFHKLNFRMAGLKRRSAPKPAGADSTSRAFFVNLAVAAAH